MVLHLAHHKSYHPYNAANIARVKADEAAAELEEASQTERASLADSEARIEALRKKAGLQGRKRRRDEDNTEKALDRQLQGRGWAAAGGSGSHEPQSRATIVRPGGDEQPESSHDANGHINFWADYENGRKLPGSSKRLDSEKASTKSQEQQDWEERHTMYLSKPAPEMEPWYAQRDLQSGKSRRRSQDQVLEDTFKDSELKRTHDPLANMEWFLKKRQQRQSEPKRSRYEETPQPKRGGELDGPPLLKARPRRGELPEWKRQALEAAAHDEYAPTRPPRPPSSDASQRGESSRTQAETPESAAQSREKSERARAQAIKAEGKRRKALREGSSSVASTPLSEAGYHEGYNKDVTRGLRRQTLSRGDGWKSRPW